VYQGSLPSTSSEDEIQGQQQVAIKKFSSESSSQSRKEFEAEVMIIGRLRHRNLVRLLGWCDSRRGLLLVYDLMPQGSLDKHIHSTDKILNWPERYNMLHPVLVLVLIIIPVIAISFLASLFHQP
jgi:serine/threonine protein kinase